MEKKLSFSLQKSLANTFALYLKVHSFHWNVTGVRFLELHSFFEELYTHLWKTTDTIAEEIRMTGNMAPQNISELLAEKTISDSSSVPSAEEMMKIIIADLDMVMQSYADTANIADDEENEAVEAVMYGLVGEIRKVQWKMKSMA